MCKFGLRAGIQEFCVCFVGIWCVFCGDTGSIGVERVAFIFGSVACIPVVWYIRKVMWVERTGNYIDSKWVRVRGSRQVGPILLGFLMILADTGLASAVVIL